MSEDAPKPVTQDELDALYKRHSDEINAMVSEFGASHAALVNVPDDQRKPAEEAKLKRDFNKKLLEAVARHVNVQNDHSRRLVSEPDPK
jgi:Skp family chaperone for outer membrane proteins